MYRLQTFPYSLYNEVVHPSNKISEKTRDLIYQMEDICQRARYMENHYISLHEENKRLKAENEFMLRQINFSLREDI